MIARADTPKSRARFLRACEGRTVYGAVLPVALELFGKAMPGRFWAAPTLALDVGGDTAWAAGSANPDELASFLGFCGCEAVMIDEAVCPAPTGWHKAEGLAIFGLRAGAALPLPDMSAEAAQRLRLNTQPSAGAVAAALCSERGRSRDDLYSELCTKRARGKALVWTLEDERGDIACTVGAYAIHAGSAYMACGQTAEPLRGHGIGGWLIVKLANALSADGLRPVFLCKPERVRFYARLGFEKLGELALYVI